MTEPRARPPIRMVFALALAAALAAGPASAQLLGGGLPTAGLPPASDLARRIPGPDDLAPRLGRSVQDVAGATVRTAQAPLAELRRMQALDLLRVHPEAVEADAAGEPVVRGEVLALSPDPAALARAREAGFTVRRQEDVQALGLQVSVLGVPAAMPAAEALRRLRALDPEGRYDLNHIYFPGGAADAPPGREAAAQPGSVRGGVRIGLVDGGVAAHPSLAGARVTQRGFAPGGVRPSAHGTAVASLLVGRQGRFRGAAPGAALYVADVYGSGPTGGSAGAVARGLAWLAQLGVPVVNVSLVGPPDIILGAAVQAMVARGRLVVAAVGNDGPAAAPLYPASYPGVVAVTAVDARRRLLPEAGRALHLDFAAPGADMAAATPGGYAAVRGTSFAAPLAAGRLALLLGEADAGAARRALAALAGEATDLGAPGADPLYGRGLVAFDLRTDPAVVGARRAALAGR
ncbi:S8 family serine peptidase [Phenylobacterium sp.]|jgi:subtilisin family serine protease|uniref:S8 family serine peptidase n=1 Tax=Phenylobacterium sp. TaxID=1871053 RepID=UPI002F41CECA